MRKLIRADGTTDDLPRALTADAICRLIGAETLDFVSLRHLGEPLHVMAVDDSGYEIECREIEPGHLMNVPVRALKPVNAEATRLYHANTAPGTTHQIVGDVVVLQDDDFAG